MSKLFTLFTTFVLLVLMAVPSYAEHDAHSHDHENIELKPVEILNIEVQDGEAVIVVQGIVCSFCSQGVKRKLSKLPFIDSSRYSKGVEIEKQKVTIAIKPRSDFEIDEVFRSIKSGGYEPVVAYRNIEGERVAFYPEG